MYFYNFLDLYVRVSLPVPLAFRVFPVLLFTYEIILGKRSNQIKSPNHSDCQKCIDYRKSKTHSCPISIPTNVKWQKPPSKILTHSVILHTNSNILKLKILFWFFSWKIIFDLKHDYKACIEYRWFDLKSHQPAVKAFYLIRLIFRRSTLSTLTYS